ncbi:hypothetical protein D3C75_872070 [compost metagenome]
MFRVGFNQRLDNGLNPFDEFALQLFDRAISFSGFVFIIFVLTVLHFEFRINYYSIVIVLHGIAPLVIKSAGIRSVADATATYTVAWRWYAHSDGPDSILLRVYTACR